MSCTTGTHCAPKGQTAQMERQLRHVLGHGIAPTSTFRLRRRDVLRTSGPTTDAPHAINNSHVMLLVFHVCNIPDGYPTVSTKQWRSRPGPSPQLSWPHTQTASFRLCSRVASSSGEPRSWIAAKARAGVTRSGLQTTWASSRNARRLIPTRTRLA